MNLTVEQRRMVVEYFATKCVEEMPSEDTPKAEFFRDLHSAEWRIRTMKAIEKVILEEEWSDLLEDLLDYQSFDRNPEQWMYENGAANRARAKYILEDFISLHIDAVARY